MPDYGGTMKVLIACEFSGIVRDAFIERGHDAISCDLLPTERPGPHIQGDVLPVLREAWDLVIAHPPCTYLALVGNRWMAEDPEGRTPKMIEGVEFFKQCWNANAPLVCVENPAPLQQAAAILPKGPQQYVNPWHHGDPYSKRTGLWLKNLPPLFSTMIVKPIQPWHNGGGATAPGLHSNQKMRAQSFEGIADAMADQWGRK